MPRADVTMRTGVNDFLEALPGMAVLALGVAAIGALGIVDYLSGSELAFSIFYVGPVLFVSWYVGRSAGAAASILAVVVWVISDALAGVHYSLWAVPVWNSLVRLGFFLGVVYLLGSVQTANMKILALAHTDSLTGLANARSFYRELEREMARQHRHGLSFALAYLDLDHFKEVNDLYGHAAGDELLREVGTALSSAVRESDVVARLGGDEFGVLMPEIDETAAALTFQRIQDCIAQVMWPAAERVEGAAATIGVVVFHQPPESPDVAVREADMAMYEGKHLGRGRVRLVVRDGANAAAAVVQGVSDSAARQEV